LIRFDANQRIEILRAVFEENRADRQFWRERAWKTVSAAVTAVVGLGGVSIFRDATIPFVVLIIGVWGAATAYLLVSYARYRDVRAVRLNLQEALGLFEEGIYLEDRSLIPAKHRRSEPRASGLVVFLALLLLVTTCAVAAVLLANRGVS